MNGLVKGEDVRNLSRCVNHRCGHRGKCHRYRLATEEAPTSLIKGRSQVTTYTIFTRKDGKCVNQIKIKP